MTFPQPTLHSHSDPRAGLRAEIREEEEMSRLTPIFTFQRLVVSLNINYWNVNNFHALIDIPLVFQEAAKTRSEMEDCSFLPHLYKIHFFLLLMQFTPPPKKSWKCWNTWIDHDERQLWALHHTSYNYFCTKIMEQHCASAVGGCGEKPVQC